MVKSNLIIHIPLIYQQVITHTFLQPLTIHNYILDTELHTVFSFSM